MMSKFFYLEPSFLIIAGGVRYKDTTIETEEPGPGAIPTNSKFSDHILKFDPVSHRFVAMGTMLQGRSSHSVSGVNFIDVAPALQDCYPNDKPE